ncbi:MAG TPA: hypothetical protein VMU56_06495, partial [Beijerinckiaceae bacterium]|nr:hypothetical protein [Beijerinckiaceae bacterium]
MTKGHFWLNYRLCEKLSPTSPPTRDSSQHLHTRKIVRPFREVMTSSCLSGALLLALLNWAPRQANAAPGQSAQAFYKGKIITVIIPYGAAGGYEYWAAALKPYFEKALGVSRIDLVNKTGGGGLIGANDLYQAKPDGLTI